MIKVRVADDEGSMKQARIGGMYPIQPHPQHARACAHMDVVGGFVEI